MTKEERIRAIKAIKVLLSLQTYAILNGFSNETIEALDIAIESLKAETSCEILIGRS